MSMMKFSDGMTFNTDGPMRPVCKSDGWYVVGEGTLMAVDDIHEAREFIKRHNERKAQRNDRK